MIPHDASIEPHHLVTWPDKALCYDGRYYVSFDAWGRIRAAADDCGRREILTHLSVVQIPDRSMNSGGINPQCEQIKPW
jgi:hypothetical protein